MMPVLAYTRSLTQMCVDTYKEDSTARITVKITGESSTALGKYLYTYISVKDSIESLSPGAFPVKRALSYSKKQHNDFS